MQISSDSRRAQQDIDRLRREIQTLRTQLGQTSGASNTATEAVDRLGDESAQTARQVRNLGEAQNRATGGTQVFTRSLGGLGTVLGGLGITAAGAAVLGLGANATRAAIQVESATNSFAALGLGVAGAEERVMQLIELSQNPGISFPQAIQAATRLETVGISGLRADAVIREFGNSLALVGSTDLSGILLGLTQIVSAGKVTTEEIRQITERSGLAAQAIRQEFGSLIGDDIQNSLEEAGQGVQDFVDRLVNRLSTQGRAAVDSTQNSFQNLQNSVFLLSAEIGGRFTPALGAAARGVSSFIDGITEAIQSSERFAEVLARVNAEITAASGQIELRAAIESGREALEAFIRQSEAAIRNNSVFFGGREDAILTGQINQAREALAEFVGIQEQQIETEAELRAELALQEAELERIQNAQTERNNLIAEQGISARNASRIYLENLEQEDIATNASIDELEAKLAAYEAVGTAAEESTGTATEGTDTATESTKELVTEVQRLTEIYNGLTQHIQEANELFDFIAQANTPEFYRLVRSELEAYGGAVDTVIPSVINLKNELEALTAAFDANLQVLDPESDVIDNLVRGVTDLSTPLTDASDETQALAQELRDLIHQANIAQSISEPFEVLREDINLVNPAISAAAETMENYITVMGAVQGEFQTIDTLSDRLTAAIRDQASAFDDLATSAGRASQGVGSGVFDQFSGRTPGTASGITGDNALDLEGIIGGIQGIGLDFLREGAALQLENAAEIDTVTESLAVFGDVAARLAAGDLTALGTAVTRTFGIINDTNEAFAERRRLRGIEANEEHLSRAGRFRNLQRVADITGVDINSDDLGGFRQNLASGLTGFTALFSTEFEDAINAANLSEGVGQALFQLVADIDRELTSEDIQRAIATFHEPIISSLENLAGQAAFNLDFASQTGGDVQGALQEVIGVNTALTQAQIDAANEQRRATGTSVENVEELNRVLNALNNQSRLQLDALPPNLFTIASGRRAAQSTAERTGTDRQATEDVARAQYGDAAYQAEFSRVDDATLAAALQANQESIAAINVAIAGLDNAISQSNDPAEIEQLLQQIAIQIPERYRLLREALQQQLDAGEITQGEFDTSIEQLGIDESAAIERNSDAMLANALLINRQAIEAINVQVAGLENAISQSNDPAEIESLLLQLAQQIPEIYRLRRNALSQQFAAGEITLSEFNNSLASLGIEQSAALERNSDAQLANTLLINQTAQTAIATEVSALQQAIAASNDPEEIANLLQQIAAQIPETYRLKRNALSAQFAAGEITAEQFQNGYGALETEQAAEVERNSDAQLSNALQVNQSAQTAIHTEISALEQAITTSNDPAEIAMLLMQIAEQIPEKYRLKREALQAQFDANEITIEQLQNGLAALDIEQAAEFERNSDAILANALSDHNADVVIISNAIHSVSEEIRNSDDPARIVQLVESLSQIIMEKFRLRREFLQKRLDAEEITVKEYQGQLGRLDIQESGEIGAVETLGESRIETITRPAPSVSQRSTRRGGGGTDPAQAAQRAADEALANALRANQDAQDTISVEVSALENVISESNDPTEITGLLMQIAEQIPETYRLRREALQTQFDASKITQGQLDNGLAALDIEQSAMIERNSDAQLANALRINSEAIDAISADVSALENQIAQSNDPAEIAALLQQIAAQIPETYRLRREALQKQYDAGEITLSALNTGLSQLNIEQSAALEQNSDAMLANALSMNQQAAEAINTHIAGLESRIAQSNDPAEIATLLQQIAQQIPAIYRLRREALQRQFDAGEITLQALNTGLAQANIDESAALEQNSDAQLANTLSVLSTNAQVVNNSITSLSEQIRNSTDPAEIATLVVDLQNAVMEKYRLQREVFQKQLDAEEITIGDFNAQLGSINLSETSELTSAAALGGAETDDLRRTSNALLQNALQRAQENLTGATSEEDFETRRQELLRFIEEYYDAEKARIDALMLSESQLRDQQEDTEFARQRALQQATTATNRFAEDRIRTEEQVAEERLRTEQRLSDEIEGIRDDQLENEADRQQSLQDLAEDHQDRLTDIERDGLRRREDLQRELSRDFADNFREEQEQIAELLSGEGFDTREIRRFLQGFEGDVRGRLGEDALSQLNEIQREGAVESIDLRRERDRDLEDIGIREGRQVEDAERRLARSEEEVNAQAQATAAALTTALAPLLGMQAMLTQQQQDTAVLENVTATNTAATAATQVRTAMKEETNAAMTAATAGVESNTAARRSAIAAMEARLQEQTATNTERFGMGIERFVEIPDLFLEVGERLTMSADRLDFSAAALTQSAELWATALGRDIELLTPAERPDFAAQDAVSLQPDIDAALAMAASPEAVALSADIVNVTGGTVNVSGDVAGGVRPQTPARPVEVTIQHNQPVQIDGQTLGRIVDEVLVRLDTNGGTVGSYVRRDT